MVTHPLECVLEKNEQYSDTISKLKIHVITDTLSAVQHNKKDYDIKAVYRGFDDIPVFLYPLLIHPVGKKPTYVLDLRPYSKGIKENNKGELEIEPKTPASWNYDLVPLMNTWYTDSNLIITFSNIPMKIFGNWCAENICKKLGISITAPDVENKMKCLFAGYYQLRGIPSSYIKSIDWNRFCVPIARAYGLPIDDVINIFSGLSSGNLTDPITLCKTISDFKWSPRLNNFSFNVLVSLMGQSGWFGGPDAKNMLIIALEYPPMFLILLQTALSNKSYKDTSLSQIAKRFLNKNHDVEFFLANLNRMQMKG